MRNKQLHREATRRSGSATWYAEIDSPVGMLRLSATYAGLAGIEFQSGARQTTVDPSWAREPGRFGSLIGQLGEYFDGKRTDFDVELAPLGTQFQRAVWGELRKIPFGTSISYAELARRIGKPTAFRAVGAANGANPWPIVVPCHRVIGSDRSLTGFGGGLDVKRRLLLLEAETSSADLLVPAGR